MSVVEGSLCPFAAVFVDTEEVAVVAGACDEEPDSNADSSAAARSRTTSLRSLYSLTNADRA